WQGVRRGLNRLVQVRQKSRLLEGVVETVGGGIRGIARAAGVESTHQGLGNLDVGESDGRVWRVGRGDHGRTPERDRLPTARAPDRHTVCNKVTLSVYRRRASLMHLKGGAGFRGPPWTKNFSEES